MPFFIRGKNPAIKKRKKVIKGKPNGVKESKSRNKTPAPHLDEEITSDEDDIYDAKRSRIEDESVDEEDEETAQEKKVRLAKQYLAELKGQVSDSEGEGDGAPTPQSFISTRLREEVEDAAGRLQRQVAEDYYYTEEEDSSDKRILRCKQHKLAPTCLVVSHDCRHIYSASKDCSIVKWSMEGVKLGVILGDRQSKGKMGHRSCVLSLALSQDSKFLASGDAQGCLHVWSASDLSHLRLYRRHRGPVTGLAFRRGTHTLYSAGHDRLVMVWDLDSLAFVEHLGGHQSPITGIDALTRESCVTSGGRDESVIVYVIAEDKQLIMSGHQGSIDGVKLVNDKTFVTFGQNGTLALWTTLKKRPHHVLSSAHGLEDSGEPRWITAMAALVNTDLVASGSSDGFVRLWRVQASPRALVPLFSIPVPGFINGLDFASDGLSLVAAVGQEHRLGRWFKDKEARNSIVIISLQKKDK